MRSFSGVFIALSILCGCSSESSTPASQSGSCTGANVPTTVFAQKCAGSGCHSPGTGSDAPANDLDLVSPGVEARVNGVAAVGCGGQTLVVGGDAASSFLYHKVADAKPACGSRMPVGATLSAAEQTCVRDWIASLPPKTSSGTDAGTDTGGGPVGCTGSLTSCGGACVDTSNDPKNCGSCDNACTGGMPCSGGKCLAMCPSTTTNCAGSCVDTQSDAKNCGTCGKACAAGEVCTAGTCACGADVSFASAVQPIFTKTCTSAGCHSGVLPRGDLSLVSGKSYTQLVNVASSECSGKVRVKPGDVANSYLENKLTGIGMCTGSQMPKIGTSLPASELATIRSWICNGAKNN